MKLEPRENLWQVAAVGILAVCLIGFVTGTSPSRYVPVAPPEPPGEPLATTDVPPARTHAELALDPWGTERAARRFRADTVALRPKTDPESLEAERSGGVATGGALERRAERRAYDGAPPVIPHPVGQGGAAECLACHAEGLRLGDAVAPRPSHPPYASCTQCHVVAGSAVPGEVELSAADRAVNDFRGLASPQAGLRWWAHAPPLIPHRTQMRGDCITCHGPAGRPGLRTTHPERRSCTQCHALSAALDQRAAPEDRRPFPPAEETHRMRRSRS